jgi:hypothetical protein
VLYLILQGIAVVEIHADLGVTLKTEAVCYGSVTRYLRSRSFATSIDPGQSESPDPVIIESDKAIAVALEEQPFASVRQLARGTYLASSTVYCHLTEKLGSPAQHLHWIPHILSAIDKRVPAQLSFQFLELWGSKVCRSRREIVRFDESWFYLNIDHERIWPPQGTAPLKENDR